MISEAVKKLGTTQMSIAARLQHKLRTDLRKEHDTAITASVLGTQQGRTSPPRGRERGVRHERAHREQFNLQTLLKPAKLTCGDNSPGCRGPGRARACGVSGGACGAARWAFSCDPHTFLSARHPSRYTRHSKREAHFGIFRKLHPGAVTSA